MTDDEIIAVVQAHKEAKQIQYCIYGVWDDTPNPLWNFSDTAYRVKPKPPEPRKPREWMVQLKEDGSLPCNFAKGEIIKLREVIDEP